MALSLENGKMKKKISELLIQIIPVMIGVYLGLLASNWADDRKMKSQTELLRTNLVAEIRANKDRIEEVINYHEMLRDSSRYYSAVENPERKPNFFSGIRTSLLTHNAFETGIQTGLINGLTFEEIQSLNKVYTIQSIYYDFSKLMLSGLITMDMENEQARTKFYRFLSIGMTDIVIKENELLQEYEVVLNELESK